MHEIEEQLMAARVRRGDNRDGNVGVLAWVHHFRQGRADAVEDGGVSLFVGPVITTPSHMPSTIKWAR